MATKKELIREFQKNYQRYWKVKLFDDLGFERRQCKNCGKFFWTLSEQEICSDSTCRPYEFIGNPPTKKKLDYFETWKVIEKFFVKNDHIPLKRYSIVCRWFSPLYFTIAGIVDFYREVNGNFTFEFPTASVILNQPCLRFNDLPNVGLNSKSFSCFLMVQQSSLYDGKNGYWKDRCIELDFELLTKIFGIEQEEIVFIEDAWLGSGAFGYSLEYHVRGLELGNAVFTEFIGTPDNYKVMKEKVVDMGGGYERFCWITQGTLTSYESTFNPVIEKMKKVCEVEYDEDFFLKYAKLCGRINVDEVKDIRMVKQEIANQLNISLNELERSTEKLEALYSIADHTRALVFAISDSAIPSNVGGGYNLRVILRRALNFIDKFRWNIRLEDVAFWHIDYLKKMFPELAKHKEEILKIFEIEEKRYHQTKARTKRIIEGFIKENKIPSEEELIKLYDSDGIAPEQLKQAGLDIIIPSDFYAKVTERHMGEGIKKEKIRFDVSGLPETKLLFYEKPDLFEFEAKVLKVLNNKFAVLDQTAFYPDAGGQLSDRGTIDGIEVTNVQKIGNVVVHQLTNKIEEGKTVNCEVDKQRREILTRHHTATHIINYAAREVLGNWVWQHSAFKDVDEARLDITHYESLKEDEVEKIENLANKIVEKNLPVKIKLMKRNEAEQKYGFRIYQGGAVPEKVLRIVEIPGYDVEACGGTHCKSTEEAGYISIFKTKRIQDGIVRLRYASGEVALRSLKEKEKILDEVVKKLRAREEEVPKEVKKLFNKWKSLRKQLKKRKF